MDRQIRRSTGPNWSEIFKILWVLINIWPGIRHRPGHKFRLGPRLGPIPDFSWSWSQNLLGPCPVGNFQYLLVLARSSLRLSNYYEITFLLQFCHHFDQAQKTTIFRNRRLEFGSIFENFLVRCSSVSDRYPGIDLWKSTFSVRWTLSRNVFEWIIHRWFNKNRS